MVAVMAGVEEVDADERPVHQGCIAGFLHLFDRPQVISGRRLRHAPRRLTSSSSGSATPSERSVQLDRGTPSSPDSTPPAAPRPSLQFPPLDGVSSAVGAAPSWRLPRLSLDSRAVVDARGKYRPRDIRTSSSPAHAPPSPSSGDRRSPSVVARLMGLDALPHGQCDDDRPAAACAGELRRSASERAPRGGEPARFRFVDPAFFERPASPPVKPAPRRAPADPARPRGVCRFDVREVFPDPAKAHGGEIALYGEIERRLRKRGIAEPARDLETLKQVLEALQLKGLLRHTPPPPPSHPASFPTTTPPPIVVMRPSHRAPPQQARLTPERRLRVDVDRARRPRSPDRSASPARSPASPARRGQLSPGRRVSPAQSPKQMPVRKASGFDAAGARSRIARRAAQNNGQLLPDEEAGSTTFSDGGSSSSFSAASRLDFEPPPAVFADETSRRLERCGKLLSSIQAFTGGDASAADQQPSPVSVLDAASFLADADSPSSSSGSKRAIDFNVVRSPRKPPPASHPEDDDWATSAIHLLAGPDASDPDYAYVVELVRLFHRQRADPADVYKAAEQRRRLRQRGVNDDDDTWHHRRLLCGAVAEALDRQRSACPWDPASWLRGAELVDHVWAEVRRAREPAAAAAAAAGEEQDLNDVTCSVIRRDLAADGPWASTLRPRRPGPEVADAVLQIERLVFKDLVADTIRELADADRFMARRKLVF